MGFVCSNRVHDCVLQACLRMYITAITVMIQYKLLVVHFVTLRAISLAHLTL